ncbi:hypothetical protein [Alcaligenes phenolicus]|uniref:hypothetical protein n=1 Tax=Alcaligenes phenolicus TaxID=232846 RepID=UPI0009F3D7A1|nr:hypothetical protein [Alcaligenes phenolicus]OQV32625.1 hypothetical protein BV899_00530 [Alcaligenes phenolicus]
MRFAVPGAAILVALFLSACQASAPVRPTPEPATSGKEDKCFQEFAALKELDPVSYEKYRQQMQTIDENFGIYKANASLIDENASEIMLTEVNKMLSLVCIRINNAVYSNMVDRVQSLNKL